MLTITVRQLVLLACLMAVLSAGSAALAVTLLQPASADAVAGEVTQLRAVNAKLRAIAEDVDGQRSELRDVDRGIDAMCRVLASDTSAYRC